jgi:hypothetical protein
MIYHITDTRTGERIAASSSYAAACRLVDYHQQTGGRAFHLQAEQTDPLEAVTTRR